MSNRRIIPAGLPPQEMHRRTIGLLSTAADYKAPAQLVFDELKVLSSPSL
jgi:hypothetical protein